MTLTIGRLTLPDCDITYPRSGRALAVSGWLTASSLIELRALVAQTWGLYDNAGEPVVPVTYTANPHLDGYYRVGQVSLPGHWLGDCEAALSSGAEKVGVPFSIGLDPVQAYAVAQLQARWHLAIRTNDHTWTTLETLIGVPATLESDFTTSLDEIREGPDADVIIHDPGGTPPASGTGLWSVPPAEFYDGAATIEMDYGDGVWRTVLGHDMINRPANWRVTNGIFRVTPITAANDLRLYIEAWDPNLGQWRNYTAIVTGGGASFIPSPAGEYSAVRVVANTPQQVVVELATRTVAPPDGTRNTLQVGLRRGMRHAECRVDVYRAGFVGTWGVKIDAGGTGDTAGQAAGALAGGGGVTPSWVIVSPQIVTRDTAEPGIHLNSGVTGFRFGLGHWMSVASENSDGAVPVARQYAAAVADVHTVVER